MVLARRRFLESSLFTGASLIFGCGEDTQPAGPGGSGGGGSGGSGGNGGNGGGGGAGGAPPMGCDDPLAGGQLLGQATFTEPLTVTPNSKTGQGLDGRLYTDLSSLTQDTLVTPNDIFYIRTAASDLLDTSNWTIQLHGLVQSPVTLTMNDLLPLVQAQGVHLLECSGNSQGGGFGLLSAADWAGVPFSELLAMVNVLPQATRVLVSGFDQYSFVDPNSISTPGASWVFTLAELERAFFATEMNGQTLPLDHGYPVRLLSPGWFGCCNIKWVNEIIFVDDTQPATSQMQEFASRTSQPGVPVLAKDYIPATIDQTAVPVRIEKWRLDGSIVYRIVGVMWGGYALTDKLAIRFDAGPLEPVVVCPAQTTNATWTLWEHIWRPAAPGNYLVTMRIDDPAVPQRRLESGRYDREVYIDEV